MPNNIVKYEQLRDIAQDLWNKAKARDIEALTYDSTTKTITATNSGTNAGTNALSIPVRLTNLVSIDEKAEFKQDVSSDNVAITNNKYIGTGASSNIVFDSINRSVGFRQLTTSAFADNYVDHIRIYVDSAQTRTDSIWTVWAITKDADSRDNDRVAAVICNSQTLEVTSLPEGSAVNKFVKIPITRSFEHETYFIARCTTHNLQVLRNVKQEYSNDSINMNASQPPTNPGDTINWNSGDNTPNNTAIMYLYGRESIGSLSLKLNQVQTDGSKYVLKTDTTDTGGEAQYTGRVVKLGDDGKINSNMLPSIAINDYFRADDFTNNALAGLTYQNGDVVVVTKDGKTTRYLCVNKTNGANSIDHFVPLDSKDGIVTKVNNITPNADGNVTVMAEHIKYNADASAKTVQAVLDEKVSNITLKNDKKKLEITRATGVTSELNLASAFAADNISYSGRIGGEERNNVKAAIDALRDEANKGVKKINNGTPDDQGNIAVTVDQTGTSGITMTFGANGGAPVQIVTYMTDTEVDEIKRSFT